MSKYPKNISQENLQIFQIFGKSWIESFQKVSYNNIKSHKKQGFTLSLENTN